MSDILSAVLAGAPADELAALPLPEVYRAAVVRRDEVAMFDGMESSEKDPRKSLHVQEVPLPELKNEEQLLAANAQYSIAHMRLALANGADAVRRKTNP